MKLTKEDFMRLPKERLAELLVELTSDQSITIEPSLPVMPTPRTAWGCDGTICTNPQMDCINCPRTMFHGSSINTSDSSGIEPLTAKQKEK